MPVSKAIPRYPTNYVCLSPMGYSTLPWWGTGLLNFTFVLPCPPQLAKRIKKKQSEQNQGPCHIPFQEYVGGDLICVEMNA